jgi:hypothetical protein
MSIYATLWTLKFPKHGDPHSGCEWVDVYANAVPEHVEGADFLPLGRGEVGGHGYLAVVIVTSDMEKGTERYGQEYVDTLVTMSGAEYASAPFAVLHEQICDALRGDHPRWIGSASTADGRLKVMFEDDSFVMVD